MALVAVRRHIAVSEPEVLLPAYACPDLVSAAIYAGLKPVLVDLVPDRPWMNLNTLQQLIGPNTVAVIAAHFLGISERLREIRMVLSDSDVVLIVDSAQLFPSTTTDTVWQGDMVILSFGRGKPMSLLGGGAVLSNEPSLSSLLPEAETSRLDGNNGLEPEWQFKLKAKAYNVILKPLGYGVLKQVPFLHLGQTIYKPLQQITPFGWKRVALLAANIIAYQKRSRQTQIRLSEMLAGIKGNIVLDLASSMVDLSNILMLRYPVLFRDEHWRDRVHDVLNRAGFGVSKLYKSSLPQIDGLQSILPEQDGYPHAVDFSKRLLTLPCHFGVSREDVELISCVIEGVKKEH